MFQLEIAVAMVAQTRAMSWASGWLIKAARADSVGGNVGAKVELTRVGAAVTEGAAVGVSVALSERSRTNASMVWQSRGVWMRWSQVEVLLQVQSPFVS